MSAHKLPILYITVNIDILSLKLNVVNINYKKVSKIYQKRGMRYVLRY